MQKTSQQEVANLYLISKAFTNLYVVAPLIVLPIVSFYQQNWWLLFGVLFSWVGVFTAAMRLYWFVTIIMIVIWLAKGGDVYSLTFYLSYLFGSLCMAYAMHHKMKARHILSMTQP